MKKVIRKPLTLNRESIRLLRDELVLRQARGAVYEENSGPNCTESFCFQAPEPRQ